MTKIEELEAKIHKVAEVLQSLRRENRQLKTENESMRSHLEMVSGESQKAQRALADYDQLRRKHEQVAHRVERALGSLNGLRSGK